MNACQQQVLTKSYQYSMYLCCVLVRCVYDMFLYPVQNVFQKASWQCFEYDLENINLCWKVYVYIALFFSYDMETKENNDLITEIKNRIQKLQGTKQSLVENIWSVCPYCWQPKEGGRCDTCG